MPAYRVNIDGRVYEGHYGTKCNAVFGAMTKDSIDRYRTNYAQARDENLQPSLIGVEAITNRKVTQKVHRVWDS